MLETRCGLTRQCVYCRGFGRATDGPIWTFDSVSGADSLAEDVADTPSRVKDPLEIVEVVPSEFDLMLGG
jgi:hypothetical protein